MGQEIAERAYMAFEKLKYGKAQKVYFKKYGDFYSVREKGNITGLRYLKEERIISWLGLKMPLKVYKKE